MNLPKFYNAVNGNYNEIHKNLISDEIIEELVLDFLQDKSFASLKTALEAGNIDSAFIAAHTLKGVSGSLGFDCLTYPVTTVTEKLRNKAMPSPDEIAQTESQYNNVIAAINTYK